MFEITQVIFLISTLLVQYLVLKTHLAVIHNQNCFETNRNKQKQPKIFCKIPKYALYRTALVGLLFVSVQLKHRNSLFGIEVKQLKQTVSKQT
jgi:hypothetical protein